MNTTLAPTVEKLFGDYWVLWYAISNSYSVINKEFKSLLDSYIASNTITEFSSAISNESNVSETTLITETITNYLKHCNQPLAIKKESFVDFDSTQRHISKLYTFWDQTIQIYYNSELVLKTIHPAIAHHAITSENAVNAIFDIYLKNEQLYLFKNEQLILCVPKRDYHLIQGKFIMYLLCYLHNKIENDWIGTLHGSTITDGHKSLLLVGKSGSGKSTLSALLVAHGFNLLADDVSPFLSEDNHIYYNPSAISIKEGAFKLLKPIVKNFDALPIINFNKTKGDLKYMPCAKPKNNHYPCNGIVLVNYLPNSNTKLEQVSVKLILETIIEDSWLSPEPKHAKQFLNWLHQVKLYQLTYSDNSSAISEISTLFHQFNNR